jgi:hypothetical protein
MSSKLREIENDSDHNVSVNFLCRGSTVAILSLGPECDSGIQCPDCHNTLWED